MNTIHNDEPRKQKTRDRSNDAVIICKKCRRSYPAAMIDGELHFRLLKEDEQIQGKVYWIDQCVQCPKEEEEPQNGI